MTARQGDDRVGTEAKRGTGARAFEERGVLRVPDDSIRDRRREPIGGATGWNPEALESRPSGILDGGPAACVDGRDHDVGTKRSRSAGLKRAGGSVAGWNSRIAVR